MRLLGEGTQSTVYRVDEDWVCYGIAWERRSRGRRSIDPAKVVLYEAQKRIVNPHLPEMRLIKGVYHMRFYEIQDEHNFPGGYDAAPTHERVEEWLHREIVCDLEAEALHMIVDVLASLSLKGHWDLVDGNIARDSEGRRVFFDPIWVD